MKAHFLSFNAANPYLGIFYGFMYQLDSFVNYFILDILATSLRYRPLHPRYVNTVVVYYIIYINS